MDKKDRILHSINAGRHRHANKGFGSWDKDKLKTYAGARTRDAKGRFIKTGTTPHIPGIRHDLGGTASPVKKED